MAQRRLPVLLLLLTACGGADLDRDVPLDSAVEPQEAAADGTPRYSDTPRSSGAAEYVPVKSRIPDGAIDRALLDRVLAAGPGWLLSEVPLQPVFAAKHKFSGFKLVSVFRNDPKVLRYGVLPGDILRAINGQKIVTPGDLLLVFERLKTADVLEIAVQRDGVDRLLQFPIVPPLSSEPAAAP